ncbi:IS21 family transposase [Pyxidicoccus caerfyrddinensis]|uniref:IS21 family transposase n=1 Tax=Pyxidicoccus caerfyrddinensis TaxID=2709663 RepID=UPI0023DD7FDA|nr:IS21 family transposase [Pyxidicoccus caerfyrddinensis]
MKVAKLSWPPPRELDEDDALTRLLFAEEGQPRPSRPEPDWVRMHLELRKKHVRKQLLCEEYKAEQPDGYQYSQYCERYARWAATLSVTMRQTHVVGETLFIDFSGDGLDVVDPKTGERRKAKLFLAVLGASNFTYAEPVLSEDLPTWVGCYANALEYMGGVAWIWVPDNLKSGVKSPDRYEPDLNPTYAELARHYGAAVIPARVRKPHDKAKVEQGVLLAERWILAALRHQTFFSLSSGDLPGMIPDGGG